MDLRVAPWVRHRSSGVDAFARPCSPSLGRALLLAANPSLQRKVHVHVACCMCRCMLHVHVACACACACPLASSRSLPPFPGSATAPYLPRACPGCCVCRACALHVYVRYMCTACALHVRCTCTACALHVRCMCAACALQAGLPHRLPAAAHRPAQRPAGRQPFPAQGL